MKQAMKFPANISYSRKNKKKTKKKEKNNAPFRYQLTSTLIKVNNSPSSRFISHYSGINKPDNNKIILQYR